jgi:FAD-dependent urate hydroxylase
MILRSGRGWHLDPHDVLTIDRFLEMRQLSRETVEPISLQLYLDYAQWFQEQAGISVTTDRVTRLDRDDGGGGYRAVLAGGGTIEARAVVVAIGLETFAHTPRELTDKIPEGRWSHTRDFVDAAAARGRRMLIVGGRQSAYEWAALLHEADAADVHVSHRHARPAFVASDWDWVQPLVERFESEPGWYQALTAEEQAAMRQRFWAEGRLKLEPWLAPRVDQPGISIRPRTLLNRCERLPDESMRAHLDSGPPIDVDHVILATGYAVDVCRVGFFAAGNLASRVAVRLGCPELDAFLQTSLPGLYWTSMAATQAFGPFFAFTVSARTSARLIGRSLRAHHLA